MSNFKVDNLVCNTINGKNMDEMFANIFKMMTGTDEEKAAAQAIVEAGLNSDSSSDSSSGTTGIGSVKISTHGYDYAFYPTDSDDEEIKKQNKDIFKTLTKGTVLRFEGDGIDGITSQEEIEIEYKAGYIRFLNTDTDDDESTHSYRGLFQKTTDYSFTIISQP